MLILFRLALALANCHLAMLGQTQHSCSEKTSLHDCTNSFPDDRSYNTYTEQLSHIDRCLPSCLHRQQTACTRGGVHVT
jgi:hypothetical protein